MDALLERLDSKLREWEPDTAWQDEITICFAAAHPASAQCIRLSF
jgi:hypothetical protein